MNPDLPQRTAQVHSFAWYAADARCSTHVQGNVRGRVSGVMKFGTHYTIEESHVAVAVRTVIINTENAQECDLHN